MSVLAQVERWAPALLPATAVPLYKLASLWKHPVTTQVERDEEREKVLARCPSAATWNYKPRATAGDAAAVHSDN